MKLRNTLKIKVLSFLLICTLLPILIVSILIFNSAKDSILTTRKEFLESIQNVQYKEITNYLSAVIQTMEALQSNDVIIESTRVDSNKNVEYRQRLNRFLRPIQRKEKFSDIFILDSNGTVIYSSDTPSSWKYTGKKLNTIFPIKFSNSVNNIQFSNIFLDTTKDSYYNFISIAPIITDSGERKGYIAIEQTMIPIYRMITSNVGISHTGESILIRKEQNKYITKSPFLHDKTVEINTEVDIKAPNINNIGTVNQRNVLAVSRSIPDLGWILLTKIDTSEILFEITNLRNITFMIGAILGLLSIIFSYLIASYITRPIIKLADFANNIEQKDFTLFVDNKLIHANDEIGLLVKAFNKMQKSLKSYYDQLNLKIEQLEEANIKINKSMSYGSIIQSSLLPHRDRATEFFSDNFFIWKPKDIVGGDIYSIVPVSNGFVMALADCTGHSIPGAFLSMLFTSTFTQIITSENIYYPDEILNRLNVLIKGILKQDSPDSLSDDGMDVAICYIQLLEKKLSFSGGKFPLIYVQEGELHIIEPNKQSIGYRRSKLDYIFTRHEINFNENTTFYLTTDGMIDQLSDDYKTFGKKSFYSLIKKLHSKPMKEQKEEILQTFERHRGSHPQLDDMMVVGFRIKDNKF